MTIQVEEYTLHVKFTRRKNGILFRRSKHGELIVNVPDAYPRRAVKEYLEGRIDWIRNKFPMNKKNEPSSFFPRYLGKDLSIVVSLKKSRTQNWEFGERDHQLTVYLNPPENTEKTDQEFKKILEDFYRQKSLELFPLLLNSAWSHYREKGLRGTMPVLAIRKMKQRLGSMKLSSPPQITLNSHIISLPVTCIEHVLYHELAHLSSRYHDKKFYSVLKKLDPDYVQRKQKLFADFYLPPYLSDISHAASFVENNTHGGTFGITK